MKKDTPEELMRRGDYEGAYRIYREIIKKGTDDATVYNNCGVALDSLGKHKDAVDCYLKAIAIEPDYPTAHYNLANSLVFLREYDAALEHYKIALTQNPDLKSAYIDLANLYLLKNDLAMMRRTLKYAISRFKYDPDLVYSAAVVLLDGGDTRTAISLLEYCLSIKHDPKYWNALGNAYYAMDNYDKAMECYNNALKLDPENAEAWNNKGFTYFTLGQMNAAIDSYTKAIELNPSYRQAWYNRAYTYHAIGKLHLAVRDYWEALKMEPMDEVAWNNMGNALYNLKRYMVSIPYFMKAVTINPNYEIAWNNIGNALDRMHMHRYSIPFHEKALSINPKFDYAWHAKGHALCELGHTEEALEFLETAIELNPDYGDTWYWRGVCLWKLERYEDAVESLKIAAERDPEEPHEVYLLLATIYDNLNYNAEALKYYKLALQYAENEDTKADILIKMRRYKEALEYAKPELKARVLYKLGKYEEVIKIQGNSKKLKFLKALSYEAMGMFENALEILKDIDGKVYNRERMFIEFLLGKRDFDYSTCGDRGFCIRVGSVLIDREKYEEAIKIFAKGKTPESYYFTAKAYENMGDLKKAEKYYNIAIGLGMEIPIDELWRVNYEKVPPKQKEN